MSKLDQRIAGLSPEKRELLLRRLRQKRDSIPLRPVTSQERKFHPPTISFAQQPLWFLDQLDPGTPAYNIHSAVYLTGRLDVRVVERSLNEIVSRHEALRTTFASQEGGAVQLIAPFLDVSLPVVDLQKLSEVEREIEIQRLTEEESQWRFVLERGPLFRASLWRLGKERHILSLTVHHIVADGWSMRVLFRELGLLYEAFSAGKPSPLSELPVQYADFAVWQRQWLQGEELERLLSYWRDHLGGSLPVMELPTDHPRPAVQTFRGARQSVVLSRALSGFLRDLSRREGVTLFMVLLAAFKVLLHRYAGQAGIVVGTADAGRNRTEVEGLIGFFVNALVLRTDLSGNPTFRELLARVREVCLGAYAHQELPFERLVEELQPERDLSRTPLFQVLFNMHNLPDRIETARADGGKLLVS
jgi:hypothetical protein